MEVSYEELLKVFSYTSEFIPRINSNTKYWFVRANGGIFYNSFNIGGYIAIGWNSITLEDLSELSEGEVKDKIKEHHGEVEKPGSPYNQMMRFAFNLNVNDIVVVPSEAPNDLLVGIITSRPYTATEDEINSASNVCPYNKRIKVVWKGVIKNENIDPQLYKLVYSGHTISDASQYKKFINRGLFDAYIDEDGQNSLMSITFKIKEQEEVTAIDFNNFISSIIEIAKIFADDNSDLKDIQIRTNVQSPGPLEFLGDPEIMEGISTVLSWTFNFASLSVGAFLANKGINLVSKSGGKLSISKEGLTAEISSPIDKQKAEDSSYSANTQLKINKLKAALEIASDENFKSTSNKLDAEMPTEIKKAIDKALIELLTDHNDRD